MRAQLRMWSLSTLTILVLLATANGLTQVELDAFRTSGLTETNTGEVGYVTVSEETIGVTDLYSIQTNAVPDHATGTFPDPANDLPNLLTAQEFLLRVPKDPEVADLPACLPEGPIAIATNGIPFYSVVDDFGGDAVGGAFQDATDLCQGRTDVQGRYYYRDYPTCLSSETDGVPSSIIGVAMDGFAIYGPIDEDGVRLTSADLDECHGKLNNQGVYQYHVTDDFPYVMGCFKGSPLSISGMLTVGQCHLALNTNMTDFDTEWPQFSNLNYQQAIDLEWQAGVWGSCSVTCGDGLETRPLSCLNSDTDETTIPDHCGYWRAPLSARQCNDGDCQSTVVYSYVTEEWSSCSATCGNSFRTRAVNCVIAASNTIVSDIQCQNIGLTRPLDSEVCVVPACEQSYSYYVSSWGSCSVTCGEGIRTRMVVCYDSSTAQQVNVQTCIDAGLGDAPSTSEACSLTSCDTYSYTVSAWGSCSATCGTATRSRVVGCVNQNGVSVLEIFCIQSGLSAPSDVEACSLSACPVTAYAYVVGDWGPCSATCGPDSKRVRQVDCIDASTDLVVPQSACENSFLLEPISTEFCVTPDCYNFVTGSWGECSATCGSSFRTRTVSCFQNDATLVDSANCVNAGLTSPATTEICTVPACTSYAFSVGSWSECSATCGVSIRSRTVTCLDLDTGNTLDNSVCIADGLTLPTTQETCTVPLCVAYSTDSWGECSATCGTAFRQRNVFCVNVGTTTQVDSDLCVNSGLTAPVSIEICTVPACVTYSYVVGSYGTCSATCGVSIRSRTVNCVETSSGDVVNDAFCTSLTKPAEQETCTVPACTSYTFTTGEWGACVATCGVSTRSRSVTCFELNSGNVVSDDLCLAAGLTEPAAVETCDVPSCTLYTYVSEDWGQCTATCGVAYRVRTVNCVDQVSGNIVLESNCVANGLTKPDLFEICSVPSCITYGFSVGEWGQCSATCGTSFRSRTVECFDQTNGVAVETSVCVGAGLTVPTSQESCTVPSCTDYAFIVGEWNECTATCGVAYRIRSVSCVDQISGATLDETVCIGSGLTRPVPIEICEVPSCVSYSFTVGEWGSCSTTCGSSFRARSVQCIEVNSGSVVADSVCVANGLSLPAETELCTVPACPVYSFSVGEWSDCSATCGTSLRVRSVTCVEQTSGNTVNAQFCTDNGLTEPISQEVCVVPDCVAFSVGPYGECSATCGTSIRSRTVTCVLLGTNTNVAESQCTDAGLTVPSAVETCVVPACYAYSVGPWGECSATCGTAVRTRSVTCTDLETNAVVAISNCGDQGLQTPVGAELCTLESCPSFNFNVGEWSECSATCGTSIRVRSVQCVEQPSGATVVDSECTNRGLALPSSQENCIVPQCVEVRVGAWGECSATCGTSFRVRTVTCNLLGEDTQVDSTLCTNAGLVLPTTVETCAVPSCNSYSVGAWGECSATCGTAFRTRTVNCVTIGTSEVVDSSNCAAQGLEQPSSTELCTVPLCPSYTFIVGEWSSCSATCGISFRARSVECKEQTTDVTVEDALCLGVNLVKPDTQEACVVPSCVEVRVGAWGECSATCGTSFRVRTVTCNLLGEDTQVDATLCTNAGLVLPTTVETCAVPSCYTYSVGGWGECSATCGTAFRTRSVNCVVLGTTDVVDIGNCAAQGLQLPESTELCAVPACPVYAFEVGEWSSCSATCGTSIRVRSVTCVEQNSGTPVEDVVCTNLGLLTPAAQEDCVVPSCVEVRVGAWGECSATCGTSFRVRTVTCNLLGEDTQVDATLCTNAGLVLPTTVETCAVPSCYTYSVGGWGECSATCGTAFRTRSVNCVVIGTTDVVDIGNCAAQGLQLPESTELCTVPACPVYAFEVGEWSSCSATCGTSIRVRSVTCVEQNSGTPVEDVVCTNLGLLAPAAQEDCAVPSCVEVRVGAWGECSATCGTSFRVRTVTCNLLGEDTQVDAILCTNAGLVLPTTVETCAVPSCYSYSVGGWGECSVTCGTAFRTRSVNCIILGTTEVVDNSNCAALGLQLPASTELCTVPACPVYAFEVGEWSSCSATCGTSIRVRSVTCVEQNSVTPVEDVVCTDLGLARPSSQEDCVVPLCVEVRVGAWGECSATCGTSFRVRTVTCNVIGEDTQVDSTLCTNAGLVLPTTVETCAVQSCYTYTVGEWGECSATCGTAFRTRSVNCVVLGTTDVVDNSNCAALGLQLPSNTELCTELVPNCPVYAFEVGEWSACSATCGTSIRVRSVTCVEQNSGTPVEDVVCTNLGLLTPAAQENCIVPQCVEVRVGAWGECSATCGTSFRIRTVTCHVLGEDIQVDSSLCTTAGLVLPTTVETCTVPACYVYSVSEWGECSATCGASFRARTVSCVILGTTDVVDSSNCAALGLTPASTTELCSVPECPVYTFIVGEWSSCSATCGTSFRARSVECVEQISGTLVEDVVCTDLGLTRPVSQEDCIVPQCVEVRVGAWGECTATCGTSFRIRTVTCNILGEDTQVDSTLCTNAGLVLPTTVETCAVPSCYTYSVGAWGECSATCGTAFRTRTVNCVVIGTSEIVDNSNCVAQGLQVPVNTELCTVLVPACPVYAFEVGEWSSCSATCGTSIRVRSVTCVEQNSGTPVEDVLCTDLGLLTPAAQEDCVVPQCVEVRVGAWGECSATCGTSFRVRTVTCNLLGEDVQVDSTLCTNAGLVLPSTVETCAVPSCFTFLVGPWGECSATCGTAFRVRTISCVVIGTSEPVDNSNCLSQGLQIGETTELCTSSVPVCPVYAFNVGEWGQCSATCGTSIRVRSVTCVEQNSGTLVEDVVCTNLGLVRPSSGEDCVVPQCVEVNVGAWGEVRHDIGYTTIAKIEKLLHCQNVLL
ncbi:uncharacterized protein LOC144451758 [Glandiceps talaboti]